MELFHLIKCGIKFIFDSKYRFVYLSGKGVYNKIADDEYLKKKFYAKMGYKLDLSNPKTFNEKMQWLKLYDRNLDYVQIYSVGYSNLYHLYYPNEQLLE